MDFRATYGAEVRTFIGRALQDADAIPEDSLVAAERQLGYRIPTCLRTLYEVAGNCAELVSVHNHLLKPQELTLDGDWLVFMNENQGVVSWGFRAQDLSESNPIVWQRNNTPPVEWYSEDKDFVGFLNAMLEWYSKSGIWES